MTLVYSTVVYSPLHGFILNQLDDQLPVGSSARLVKRCTGIAEVMGSNPPTGLNFFRPYSHYCSSSFVEKVVVIHRGESP